MHSRAPGLAVALAFQGLSKTTFGLSFGNQAGIVETSDAVQDCLCLYVLS